ncbi:hypothetical protein JZO70_00190 [Enterococcus sp. 669A]|uniref:DUF6434 domain-containing protein n=1 Tax=Candidatus Enterococcus moelleringii TaxID=2815325 RepID=A0ABS3L708_9ENTE|nr:DUF6434 domain-containing protein [Enterococcus sp. 669A]MBO1304561.1 hypothetical protein [Enterococcus sp. 669A]
MKRSELTNQLTEDTFHQFYYLKEELVSFCRQEQLQTTGSKQELTQRISHYLATGERKITKKTTRKNTRVAIALNTPIEADLVCSEIHRAFFKKHLGQQFSFNVAFQNWLKANTGKTYQEALLAYQAILEEKKKRPTTIGQQFEYNTYIRAFFTANQGRKLPEAIACWKYKKAQAGPNVYEPADLAVLSREGE